VGAPPLAFKFFIFLSPFFFKPQNHWTVPLQRSRRINLRRAGFCRAEHFGHPHQNRLSQHRETITQLWISVVISEPRQETRHLRIQEISSQSQRRRFSIRSLAVQRDKQDPPEEQRGSASPRLPLSPRRYVSERPNRREVGTRTAWGLFSGGKGKKKTNKTPKPPGLWRPGAGCSAPGLQQQQAGPRRPRPGTSAHPAPSSLSFFLSSPQTPELRQKSPKGHKQTQPRPPQLPPTGRGSRRLQPRRATPTRGCVTGPAPAAGEAHRCLPCGGDLWRPQQRLRVLSGPSCCTQSPPPPPSSLRGAWSPGKEGGRENKGALPPAEASYSRLTTTGRGLGACPSPGRPRRQLLSYRGGSRRPPGRRGCCRAYPRRGAPSGIGRARRGRGRLSGAGCEGTVPHRRRDEGPSQRGRGLRALPLPAPMASPQRGLPAPRPPSGTEAQSIQRGGRRGPRLRGWLSLSPPHPPRGRGRSGGCRQGSLRPPPPPGAPAAPSPPP